MQTRSRIPALLAVPAVIGFLFLLLPLASLVIRAPWGSLGSILADASVLSALWLSLLTATTATVIAVVLGLPLAWMLARGNFVGLSLVRSLVTVPLVLPPVVGGVALLLAFGRTGLIGRSLDLWFGITIPFTTVAVVMAQTFVAMPFLVVTIEGALRSLPKGLDEAASTLGASRLRIFFRLTLPALGPSLLAGTVLCWARALGEFGATITFAGNFPGTTQTMPLQVYLALQTNPEAAMALSLVLLAVAVAVLALLRDKWVRGVSR